jgi:predicted site-specific integrase-resolvase
MKRYFNASDVARLLKVNRATIMRWIKKGIIKGEQKSTGRKEWYITITEFEEFVKKNHESSDI